MPFQYQEIRSPFVGSLSDLMMRKGDIAAHLAEQVGQAQAQAVQASGQAWAGAARDIGDTAGKSLALAVDPLRRAEAEKTRIETENLKAQQAQNAARLKGQATVNGIIANLMTQQPDGSYSVDRKKLAGALAAQNVPLDVQQASFKALDDVDASVKNFNQARIDHAADLAHGILTAPGGATPDNVLIGAALAKANGLATDEQIGPLMDAVAQGHDLTPMLSQMRGMSEKYKDLGKPIILPRPGASAVNPLTGDTIASSPLEPKQPTEASLAMTAAGGDAGKALGLLHAGKNPPSLEEQYLTAITKGDSAGAQTILKTLQDTANAKRDPVAQQQVNELRKMNMQTAQQRLDDLNPQSTKNQQKLEQEYRGILQSEFRSRSGGLGMEDQKVNQALHQLTLLDQYEGKNMPAQIHAELALGLAKLTAPNGQVGIELEREFKQRTAQEGVAKAVSWLTGDPTLVNATPDALRAMYRDSITRQGQVSEQNREQYFNAMKAAAPTDLSADRREKLEKALTLNRMPPSGAPAAGTVRNGATWKNGPQGWGWYR